MVKALRKAELSGIKLMHVLQEREVEVVELTESDSDSAGAWGLGHSTAPLTSTPRRYGVEVASAVPSESQLCTWDAWD